MIHRPHPRARDTSIQSKLQRAMYNTGWEYVIPSNPHRRSTPYRDNRADHKAIRPEFLLDYTRTSIGPNEGLRTCKNGTKDVFESQ